MAADIAVTMACGCRVTVNDGAFPECAAHQERRVVRAHVPAPRITAVDCDAAGPHVRKG